MKLYLFFYIIFEFYFLNSKSYSHYKSKDSLNSEMLVSKLDEICLEKEVTGSNNNSNSVKNKGDTTAISCKVCIDGYFNHNGNCLEECPEKTFANIKTKKCDISDSEKYIITNSSGSCINRCLKSIIKSFNCLVSLLMPFNSFLMSHSSSKAGMK